MILSAEPLPTVDHHWMRVDAATRGDDTTPWPMTTDDFVSSFKKPLDPSVILSTPKLRQTRSARAVARGPSDEELILKRSARLAAKSKHREPKPEAQARKVMMKRLGVHVDTELPDKACFDEFHTAFTTPLSEWEAMQVLFLGRKQRALGSVRAA
jgi:hypothetical protein